MEMKVADPSHRLRPGMYTTVQLGFDALDPGILVPETASSRSLKERLWLLSKTT